MLLTTHRRPFLRAFTLIELVVVIVVLAILSGVAIPKYLDYSAKAKESAVKATLGAVRASIANWYANQVVSTGTGAYPTLTQLQTNGVVMAEAIPGNPYTSNNSADISAATWSTTPPISGSAGWNYDAAAGRFWANTNTTNVEENAW